LSILRDAEVVVFRGEWFGRARRFDLVAASH
jgi:hypothetical protein